MQEMNKFDAKELFVRLTSIKRIDAGPAREVIKDWVQQHRAATYKALEELAAKESRMTFVDSTYCGKWANETGKFDAYSPAEISVPIPYGTVDYLWLTEESLFVRVEVNDYDVNIVTPIVPSGNTDGADAFWKAVVDEFVTNNIEEFGGELQVMKDRVCLMFRFRKDIPDFITPHAKG